MTCLSQLRLFGRIHTCHTSEDAVFHCQSEDFRGHCFCLLLLHLCPTIRAVVWNPKWCFFINVSVFAFVALYRRMVLSGVMYPPALYVVHVITSTLQRIVAVFGELKGLHTISKMFCNSSCHLCLLFRQTPIMSSRIPITVPIAMIPHTTINVVIPRSPLRVLSVREQVSYRGKHRCTHA